MEVKRLNPNIKKVLTEAVVLTIAFWITGLLFNTIRVPFLQLPIVFTMTNILSTYLALAVALYIKEWIAPKLPF